MHHFFSMMFSLLAIIGLVSGQSELSVTNGGIWGLWGDKSMCPSGTYAAGFKLKVEGKEGRGDDTALNGISLYCVDRSKNSQSTGLLNHVESSVGDWGKWTDVKWCPSGYFTAFQLRVESSQGSGDDTAANNIRFRCSEGSVLEGSRAFRSKWKAWGNWGDWGSWSPTCEGQGSDQGNWGSWSATSEEKGICGLQTRVEGRQGCGGDNTALNDVHMFCCV